MKISIEMESWKKSARDAGPAKRKVKVPLEAKALFCRGPARGKGAG